MVRHMLWDHCPAYLSVCNVDVLWPNGWMDQDATWYRGKPQPRRHCVRWGLSSPRLHGKGHSSPSPHFSTLVYCAEMVTHFSCWQALVIETDIVRSRFWLIVVMIHPVLQVVCVSVCVMLVYYD